jgi:hypothetical protein
MKITKKRFSTILFSFGLIIFGLLAINFFVPSVQADATLVNGQVGLSNIGTAVYGTNNPEPISVVIVRTINTILSFLALIFLVLVLISGFQYMTSGGNDEKVKKSVGRLKTAIIGLIIILSAWGITHLLVGYLACRVDSQAVCSPSFYGF